MKRPQREKTKRSPRAASESRNAASTAENRLGPDRGAAQDLVLELLSIPGVSAQEGQVAEFITKRLREAGAPRDSIQSDEAHRRSRWKGEVGNLIFHLPGTTLGPRRLLMAHVDTVPLCQGARPVVRGGWIVPADKKTALGADDRSGAAVVLLTALEILRRRLPHPPLTFLWTVQEEVGLYGARHLQRGLLRRPRLAFNFDGGSSEKLTIGATGGYRMEIRVDGVASHAGSTPEMGVSAIAIASLAVADLYRDGWHGLVEKNGRRGTSNIGVIAGGQATNVVTPLVELRAEARSHDPEFRGEIIRAIEEAFGRAAGTVRSVAGVAGSVHFDGRLDYEAFLLKDDEPCVLAAEAAVKAVGGTPFRATSNGGLDANWMTARGIPTVTLGCGQTNPHTAGERLELDEYQRACAVALKLAMATERPA